jgi:predicted DNA-binding transcriptional regulator YafY
MGRRGGTETLAVVLLAFLERNTWRQAELAQRAGVQRKTLVRILVDLQHADLRLTRKEEPPQVYWSVPKTWFPGCVAFQGQDLVELAKLIQRTPRSEARDRILNRIRMTTTSGEQNVTRHDALLTQTLSKEEEARLCVLQESVDSRTPLRVQYFTLSRGDVAWRHISVHRILLESRRVIATCHHADRLEWFRFDGILTIDTDCPEPFRLALAADIQQFLDQSVDGYHSGGAPVRCVFRVLASDARWVRPRLSLPLLSEEHDGVVVYTALTAGLLPLARVLAGCGGAVTVDTLELRQLVIELAQAALKANGPASLPRVVPLPEAPGQH